MGLIASERSANARRRPGGPGGKENPRILLANSRRGSFARKLGKMGRAEEANPRFPDAWDEFANSIPSFASPGLAGNGDR
jgi:hypothetical protein